MTAHEAVACSTHNKAEKSYEVQQALLQVKAACGRGERQCWLTDKLSESQAQYIRGLGYNLTYPNNNGALTW